MRKRIFEIIENTKDGDTASSIYDIIMLVSIVASLIPLCTKSTATWTLVVDLVTVSIFIIDYILREATADYKFPELRG